MGRNRLYCGVLLLVMALNTGCAALLRISGLSEQDRTLAAAMEQLRNSNEARARELLEQLIADTPVAGVTDEALFRLALLSLRDETGKVAGRTQQLLERLATDYPESLWNRQSVPLSAHLAEVKALRAKQRELKALRDTNLSLSRDNKELRQNLERLKQLDLELEQKIKR